MTWATTGRTVAELDAFSTKLASSIGLAGRLHGEAVAIVRWAESRGLPVHLVSVSPRAIVERAFEASGLVGLEMPTN
jgi:phosphatidylglycerophosphatase C